MATPLPAGAVLSTGSQVTKKSGMKWDRTGDGAMAGRDMWAQPWFTIAAQFQVLPEADAQALEDFLQSYRSQLVEVKLRQYTYSAYVTSDVQRTYIGGDGLVRLSVQFEGVRV